MFNQRRGLSNHFAVFGGIRIVVLAVTCTGIAQTPKSNLTVLYNFTGSATEPMVGIMDSAGNIYGTSSGGGVAGVGTVFKVDATGHETVLYSFKGSANGDGAKPNAGLVMDAAGNLYGTTFYGGSYGGSGVCTLYFGLYAGAPSGCGTVFKLDPTGHETVLHSFTGANGDGAYPNDFVTMDSAGNLYGTTYGGGNDSEGSSGIVFKVDPSGNETVLYSFGASNSDGAEPEGGLLLDSAGNLFGTTSLGGTAGAGTIFKLDPSGHETVLYSFTGANGDGAEPTGRLVKDSAGNLYGTTLNGGKYGWGTVFKLNTAGNEMVLYSFSDQVFLGADADLTIDNAGNLYGTSPFGGGPGGDVFKIDPAGNLTVFYTFTGGVYSYSGGLWPNSDLLIDSAGNLYGSTERGGSSGGGILFKLDSTGNETVIYSFSATNGDGAGPNGDLIMDSAGTLYGTTSGGGIWAGYCGEGHSPGSWGSSGSGVNSPGTGCGTILC